MRVWNMGNTTARNPLRLRDALTLFIANMSGRPFKKPEQIEFQVAMIEAGLVNSQRMTGDDGGRKFASAFKQLGFVTDWSKGQAWNVTTVGQLLIDHPEIEETIFLRQLLKYQIASPLEKVGTQSFHLRPFRLLLRFLKHAHDTGLIGLTIPEIGLYVITTLDEAEEANIQSAFSNIQQFRTAYEQLHGRVAKTAFAKGLLKEVTAKLALEQSTLEDYADSNSRYALMTGLLTLYAPAFFEWAIWRLFLAIDSLVGPVSSTRGFKVDEDINPVHHAQGGAADLTFTYDTFKLVCEMTLATGSRQFAMEGEPVTRHVFKVMQQSDQKPVYGLFIANKLDPNTIDAFHKARYWKDFKTSISTPIVALETKHILALLQYMRTHQVTIIDIQKLFSILLDIQIWHENGPSWYEAYTKLFEQWLRS